MNGCFVNQILKCIVDGVSVLVLTGHMKTAPTEYLFRRMGMTAPTILVFSVLNLLALFFKEYLATDFEEWFMHLRIFWSVAPAGLCILH